MQYDSLTRRDGQLAGGDGLVVWSFLFAIYTACCALASLVLMITDNFDDLISWETLSIADKISVSTRNLKLIQLIKMIFFCP